MLLGLLAGYELTINANSLVNWIENSFHVQLLSSNIYFVDVLPYEIQIPDLVKVCVTTFIACLIATLYPAWRASRVQPAEALRYE